MPKRLSARRPRTSRAAAKLSYQAASAWQHLSRAQVEAAANYGEAYKRFIGLGKTERECIGAIAAELGQRGFQPLASAGRLKRGDRVYKNIKGRALAAAIIGDPQRPWRLVGAHVDSPRLDLKPNPLLEDGGLALFQSHYYGGIKKYQWVNVPLSFHAFFPGKAGGRPVTIGEAPGEAQFIIPDVPPHLAREQMEKKAREAVDAEQLRVVAANQPWPKSKETDKVKEAVLQYLHRHFGLKERDLFSADMSFVPAAQPVDIGFDRSMIAAYGQDDRACAYATLRALREVSKPPGVAIALFVDKEEIGSDGDTGAQSRLLENFAAELQRKLAGPQTPAEILERATAISADTTGALNPIFKDISDPRNTSRLGGGVSVEKYGGAGGKYDTNDASSEYMKWLVNLLDREHIPWQTGEMGRLDLGGGGTIAKYFSRYGMDAIDVGPSLLAMHSPYEVASKVDLYFAYRAYLAFFKA